MNKERKKKTFRAEVLITCAALITGIVFSACGPKKCQIEGCNNERGEGLYCSDHTCRKNGCSQPADLSNGSDFCTAHTCADPDCTNEATEYNGFCPEHIPLVEEQAISDMTETEPTKAATDDTIPEKKSSKGYSGTAPRWKPSYNGDNDKTDNVTVTPTAAPKPKKYYDDAEELYEEEREEFEDWDDAEEWYEDEFG